MAKFRITYNAPVVLTFALISAIVQLLPVSLESWFVTYPSFKYGTHAWVGLFTHIFGHANWNHLAANFMFILLIGPILEERHGSLSLLFMIAITAFVEGLANMVLTNHPMLGASGTVFMMIILASTANIRAREIPLTFLAVAAIYLGGEVVAMFRNDDQVSHLTHLIGGLAGAAFGFFGAGAPRDVREAKKPVVPVLPAAVVAQTKKSGTS
ncbi:MAG TPA: rhomboid family intramembrane serine protease [Kofleriaceae bacterium]|nr:rhomboid family intramembrane serine protease [Kofleriaceae bacterium]